MIRYLKSEAPTKLEMVGALVGLLGVIVLTILVLVSLAAGMIYLTANFSPIVTTMLLTTIILAVSGKTIFSIGKNRRSRKEIESSRQPN